jgi:hypothetical protein
MASAASNEIVASIANYEAYIVFAGEVDSGLDMVWLSGHQDVHAVVTESTWFARVRCRSARVVGEVCPQVGTRLLRPAGRAMSA